MSGNRCSDRPADARPDTLEKTGSAIAGTSTIIEETAELSCSDATVQGDRSCGAHVAVMDVIMPRVGTSLIAIGTETIWQLSSSAFRTGERR